MLEIKLYLMFVGCWIGEDAKDTALTSDIKEGCLVIWKGWMRASLVAFRSVGAINLWFFLR